MTKQEITEAILGCAEKLGRVPSILEVMKMAQVSRRQIRAEFGSFTQALRECNLERETSSGQKVPQFAEGRGLAEEWKAELELAAVKSGDQDAQWMLLREAPTARSDMRAALWPNTIAASRPGMLADWRERVLTAGPTYGPPMWPGPLAYAPVNEMGVVFLFGWMAPQLGYVVHRLQPEFPDCEAMRHVGEDRWQLVRIEFEHESRNFLKHMHDVKGCDLIICWRHNWPECPLEVLELRQAPSLQQAAVSQNVLPQNLTTD